MYSFSYLEPVCCSMPSSNYCFLADIQVSQEAGRVVWYSHLSQNFPQFIVIHTVKGFGINKAEIDVFLELSYFFNEPTDIGNFISGSSAFSKTSLNIWKFTVPVLLKPGLENFELVYKYFILCLQVSLCCRTLKKHVCHNSISSEYILFLLWLTSLCIIGSRFIYLISADSSAFLFMAE